MIINSRETSKKEVINDKQCDICGLVEEYNESISSMNKIVDLVEKCWSSDYDIGNFCYPCVGEIKKIINNLRDKNAK